MILSHGVVKKNRICVFFFPFFVGIHVLAIHIAYGEQTRPLKLEIYEHQQKHILFKKFHQNKTKRNKTKQKRPTILGVKFTTIYAKNKEKTKTVWHSW